MNGASEEIHDSPIGWVAKHIDSYVSSGGKKGHRWHGVDTLLLTTRGRKSGRLRRTALIYRRDGDRYVVVGSKGGSSQHPLWYLNLVDEPEVRVQVGSDHHRGRSYTAEGDERARLWKQMAEIWPDYEQYQKRTDRQIPVVVIEPIPT